MHPSIVTFLRQFPDALPLDLDTLWAWIRELEQTGRARDFRTSLALRERLRELITRSGYTPAGYQPHPTHPIGALAYLRTANGLVACRTVRLAEPREGQPRVLVQITGPKAAYRRGQLYEADADCVVPRPHVSRHAAGYRIHRGWRWTL